MTVIELHPEELIDRARRGPLSADEQVTLDAHLSRCAACRFEQQLAHDFAAEAALGGDSGLSALVSGALVAAAQTPSAPPVVVARRRTRPWAMLLAATLLMVSGIAAAQTGLIEQVLSYARTKSEVLLSTKRPSRLAVRRSSHTVKPAEVVDAPTLPATPEEPTPVEATPPIVSAPAIAATSPARPRRINARAVTHASSAPIAHAAPSVAVPTRPQQTLPSIPVATAPSIAVPAPRPAVTTPEAAVPVEAPRVAPPKTPEVTAPSAFGHANELRRLGRSREASAAYRELTLRFPRSAEARLALVLMARLELDHGDADAALRGFDAYLATRDAALREQALSGRALALGRLQKDDDACAAFHDLLTAYPSSTYASTAKRRCSEVE